MNIKNNVRLFAKKFKFSRSLWHFYQSFIYFIRHPFPYHNKRNRDGVVVQLLTTFVDKDAIGNAAIEISKELDKNNIKNYIVYEGAHSYIENGVPVCNFKFNKNDTIIYHMSIGCNASNIYKKVNVKNKYVYYHNITPAKYFYDMPQDKKMSELGRKQLIELKKCTNIAFCVSEYNASELKSIGYKNVVVIGIPTRIKELTKNKTRKKEDSLFNFLTVGRVARHKCIHDVIKLFNEFLKLNCNSRLYIVGNCSNKSYESELNKLINELKLNKFVSFKENVSENELSKYYANANVYLSMSEHEGFCVPLVEAMAFNIPIVAYDSSAIKETLGEVGLLLHDKNHQKNAHIINEFIIKKGKINSIDRFLEIYKNSRKGINYLIKCLIR